MTNPIDNAEGEAAELAACLHELALEVVRDADGCDWSANYQAALVAAALGKVAVEIRRVAVALEASNAAKAAHTPATTPAEE